LVQNKRATIVRPAETPAMSPGPVPDAVRNECRELMARALDFCEAKAHVQGHPRVVEALQMGDRAVHDYLRYGLAREIGSYLGHMEASVKAVYFFEPESMAEEDIEQRKDLTRGIQLIAWVTNGRTSVRARAETLGEALLKEYKALLGPAAEAMSDILMLDVVDDHDVAERTGLGAVISSVHTRPIEVWSRYVLRLNADHCGGCRICSTVCPYEAIYVGPETATAKIDLEKCQACGICYSACPAGAIQAAYYDFSSLVRQVRTLVRANGFKAIALTCRGSIPTREDTESIVGTSDYVPICLPCVGRTPTEFFLKALAMGIQSIAVIPCRDGHCRFEDGGKIVRNRVLLLQALLRSLNRDPSALILQEAKGPAATIDADLCTGCANCVSLCPYDAIWMHDRNGHLLPAARVDAELCQGCGLCAPGCPSRAIEMGRFTNPQLSSQIEAALAVAPPNDVPRILGFRCNWCSYDDVDSPFDRLYYSSQGIEVIKVPCAGRVDPLHVLWAFLNGADGVFLAGCPHDDCRYVSGSDQAEKRIGRLRDLMLAHGLDPRRLRMEWLKRGSADAVGQAMRRFASEVAQLGSRCAD